MVATPPRRLFTLASAMEAPFLIGAGGRNVSLVRKHTGVRLVIRGIEVFMIPASPPEPADLGAELLMAKRLAFSSSIGGVLRWFVTPQATLHGFPDHKVPEWSRLADSYACDLQSLRSRKGHICVLLVPRMTATIVDGATEEEEEELARVRVLIPRAREALLQAMAGPPPPPPPAATEPS